MATETKTPDPPTASPTPEDPHDRTSSTEENSQTSTEAVTTDTPLVNPLPGTTDQDPQEDKHQITFAEDQEFYLPIAGRFTAHYHKMFSKRAWYKLGSFPAKVIPPEQFEDESRCKKLQKIKAG